MAIALDDFPRYVGAGWETVDVDGLPEGCTLSVRVMHDDCMGEPWKEHDGHGPVSEWTTRDKKPGERVLCEDRGRKRFYDFAQAVKMARAEGWDAPPYGQGTPGERAARAAEADFRRLRGWCEDEWSWIVVGVRLDVDGEEFQTDYLGAVESDGDCWREQAAEMANAIIGAYEDEMKERAEWAARGVETK